ncbi:MULTISPECIES: NHLP leader peptide family RiPP precursor [unclassified Tenacibaculum]|uniref:NHLP leader peptide family RiPP precursor n=1 Tax=unclassified Tenacibaculum TaxID=2635139 RepID=UPI001F30F97B|nr:MULTISPECIES: NHLP leader peptide family RiPP precursor [unclassified Tenacibaculum]MCF2873147.1 NHLP leader peptide family RiPP precursor [Tenacibaculum sp. Cn5-1]MCF2933303.1 NHLP leader peptide family RiPP precursor [Tenacibaculum sp. Cn5-34]MCG7510116.1 NHLP leader peptide family RiPP precursor [Tenacibaculum sp. Cn5-46]
MELTREQKLFQTIVHKAWEDNEFKQQLINNPIPTIENLTGETIRVPEGKTIVVRDQTDSSIIYINIPAEPDMDDIELTEEQLEIVAGGGNPTPPIIDDPLSGVIGG